jgi:hypothetical protein
MKWSGVPFTHICEWKRHSPSSGSSGSSGWTFVVAMVTLGSASMIHVFPFLAQNQSLSQHLTLGISSQPTMTVWSDIHQYCAKGFCGTHTIFQCPSSTSHYPSLLVAWDGYPGLAILALSFGLGVRATLTILWLLWICRSKLPLVLLLEFLLDFDNISISGSQ